MVIIKLKYIIVLFILISIFGVGAVINFFVSSAKWLTDKATEIAEIYDLEERAKGAYDKFVEGLPENEDTWTAIQKRELQALEKTYSDAKRMVDDAIEEYNIKSTADRIIRDAKGILESVKSN